MRKPVDVMMDESRGTYLVDGFTLLECVMVIGLMLIVSAFAWGAFNFAMERGRRVEAEAELGMLSHALERYRDHFGSYPESPPDERVRGSEVLIRELMGDSLYGQASGFSAIRPDGLVLSPDGRAILDPWGQPYLYACLPTWPTGRFWMVSAGPDGLSTGPDERGRYDSENPDNRDDILPGG
ncbi:MAG: prepilin-type N-terminal cleavage/methylation domain-containing protein [Opitutales bacterium]|nr:prepilin-type N-terminal cleavage/methylation domain-containing protein [Opitutales bacterium]